MKTLLLGGTDLTLVVAQRMCEIGMPPVGVVHVGRQFGISYRPSGVTNTRFGDMAGWCTAHQIPSQPYECPAQIERFARDLRAEFCLAAGWYHMVPANLRAVFSLGAAGLHASLLPKFRGGAPLNWAILAGENETGISLFVLGDGVDDGPLYGQECFPIGPRTTIGELVQISQETATKLIETCLPGISDGRLKPKPQVGKATYCLQRTPDDGAIDWSLPVDTIDRLIRAVGRPYPGAFTSLEGRKLIIWNAEPFMEDISVYGVPGHIVRLPSQCAPIVIAGRGMLLVHGATYEDGSDAMSILHRSAHKRFAHFPG